MVGRHLDNDGRVQKQDVAFNSEVQPGDFPLEGDRCHCPLWHCWPVSCACPGLHGGYF